MAWKWAILLNFLHCPFSVPAFLPFSTLSLPLLQTSFFCDTESLCGLGCLNPTEITSMSYHTQRFSCVVFLLFPLCLCWCVVWACLGMGAHVCGSLRLLLGATSISHQNSDTASFVRQCVLGILSPPSKARITDRLTHPYSIFMLVSGDLNFISHICVASALTAEPPSCPFLILVFF